MARKSRVAGNVIDIVPVKNGVYRTGIYARLSSEDREEDTLENQIYLLKGHVEGQTDMILMDTYVDNGFSGTNFQRPQFIRMMEDVMSGKINCIVVKDLSRFGRNYIETGNYIENVFPFLNVRFVSVTDKFDTVNGDGVEAMVVSFKNLVNDVYAKDISRKIIFAFRTKQKNGEYIGLVAPFGYLKSADNKNKFVIDGQTAPVVQMIFRWYADGKGLDSIARTLNDIHHGKTMLTFIDSGKNYKIYDEENRVVETKRGEELYSHYDKVEASVREKYEKTQAKETTRTKTVQQKTTTTVKKR